MKYNVFAAYFYVLPVAYTEFFFWGGGAVFQKRKENCRPFFRSTNLIFELSENTLYLIKSVNYTKGGPFWKNLATRNKGGNDRPPHPSLAMLLNTV